MSEGRRVGWRFVSLYTLAYLGTVLLFLAPVLVTLALKVNALVGIERAPQPWGSSPASAVCWPWSRTRYSGG